MQFIEPRLEQIRSDSVHQGRRYLLAGRVQGLGVRPAIARLAKQLGLGGQVRNTAGGVEIEVEGMEKSLDSFDRQLLESLPSAAVVDCCHVEAAAPANHRAFSIAAEQDDGSLAAQVPTDLVVCTRCLDEIRDPHARRFGYPLTSCTLCGPRYSVIRQMPYERADTTMSEFAFCGPCAKEYQTDDERRYHAQTNACPDCGPRVWFVDHDRDTSAFDDDAIERAIGLLRSGKIIAVKGIGGYQLLVDATDKQAVERLRKRKQRYEKPLAVMVESLAEAQRLAMLDDVEQAILSDAANPIVLVRARKDSGLASSIHPGLDTVGLFLPSTPLHALLIRKAGCPLVCTSANREGDPLEYEMERAEQNLTDLCDGWLHHDREIARPIDDSVVRVIAGRSVTIRLARGLAPLALDLPKTSRMIAVGGHQKNAVAWSNGEQAVLGPHLGDQETLGARKRFQDHIDDMQTLYRFRPEAIVHDAHPEYASTTWASKKNRKTLAVQHHHAHVVAAMLEQGWLDRQVLGVAWDGTGFGTDRLVWGGEFLIATAKEFQRFAHLRPFCLPGGEVAVREPWRVAVAMLAEVVEKPVLDTLTYLRGRDVNVRAIEKILRRPQLSPTTTSAGRLFDAVASIVLGIDRAAFEGQLAMWWEAVADRNARGTYDFPVCENSSLQLDWRPLLAGVLADHDAGVEAGVISMRFHRSLAAAISEVCRQADLPVVLTGGVFQNRLLTELVAEQLNGWHQPLGLPGAIPPNDGGLAAGQLAIAMMKEEQGRCV